MKNIISYIVFVIVIIKTNSQNSSNSSSANNSLITNLTNSSININSNSSNTNNNSSLINIQIDPISLISAMQAENPSTQCILVTNPKLSSDCLSRSKKNYTSKNNFTLDFYCCYTYWKYNISSEYSQCVPWYSNPDNFESHFKETLNEDSLYSNIKVSCKTCYMESLIIYVISHLVLFIMDI